MTNRYFNFANAWRLIKDQFARSRWVNDRLDEIGAGFLAVQGEMDGKASSLGGTFTDVTLAGDVLADGADRVTVPTAALDEDDLDLAASIGYVIGKISASGTLIPPWTANAGKALISYGGSGYDWGYVVPAPAGNAGKVARVNMAGTAYEVVSLTGLTSGGVAAHSGNTTADAHTVLDITASVAGTLVTLPDATTLPVGTSYLLSTRAGTNTAGMLDSAGNILTVANSSGGVAAVLTANGTAAGTWKLLSSAWAVSSPLTSFQQIRAGAVNVSTGTSHNVKFLLQVDNTDFLLAAGESGSNAVRVRWLRTDGIQVTEVANVTLTAAGTAVNRVEILRMASGSFVLLRRCTGSNDTHATAFTLSGSTITTGSTGNVLTITNTNPASAGQYGLAWSAAVNGDKALLLSWAIGTPGVTMVAFSVSGTAITVGTKVDLRAAGANYSYGSVAACPESDKWVVTYGTDIASVGAYAFIATASGLTLTQNTEQLIHATCGAVAVVVAGSTKAYVIHLPKNGTSASVYAITITGNAVAIGSGVALGPALASGHADVLGVDIELFPGNVVVGQAFATTGTLNCNVLNFGSVASGTYVAGGGGGLSIGAATYNQNAAINRLGDLGVAHAIGVVDTHVYLYRINGTEEQMLTWAQIAHTLGANAKNAAAILMPGNRLVVVSEATSTNVTVYAAKIGGF